MSPSNEVIPDRKFGEDTSQGVFGQFFSVLYAMMVILVWEVSDGLWAT